MKISVCFKGFATFEVNPEGKEPFRFEEVEWVHPIEIPEEDLEGYMYDVAIFSSDHERGDWVTVVAYDATDPTTPTPIRAIDFGRRYVRYIPSPYGEDWPPVWDPSRDYWSRDEMPASLFFATSDEPSA